MKKELLNLIRQEDLIPDRSRCLIALSGGCDSVSLLLLLEALRAEKELELYAIHVNHGLRTAARQDEDFCISLCSRYRIPLIVCRENVQTLSLEEGLSEEEAGRKIRYRRFTETAAAFDIDLVLTAHQREDQAETLLLHLFRGTGLSGLGGIAPVRDLDKGLKLVRPLLGVSRKQLETLLQEEGVVWREDESNQENRYNRNYIRNHLMPEIEKRFPGASDRIARTAGILRATEEYLQQETRIWLKGEDPGKQDALALSVLREADAVMRPGILQDFFRGNGGLKDITAMHYQAALALLEKRSGTSLALPGNRCLIREQSGLRMVQNRGRDTSEEEQKPCLSIRTFPYRQDIKIPASRFTKWMDYAIMNDHVCLRKRADGDFFYLPDGGRKLLARYLVDEKVPLTKRDSIWVLADGSHVLWVIGYRLCAAAYVHEKTQTVAEITAEFRRKEE